LSGPFDVRIYEDSFSVKNLSKIVTQSNSNSNSTQQYPHLHHQDTKDIISSDWNRKPSETKSTLSQSISDDGPIINANDGISMTNITEFLNPVIPKIDVNAVNQAISGMDSMKIRKRRRMYNFIHQEALSAEGPRGIPFSDMLKIVSYQLVDIEQCLK